MLNTTGEMTEHLGLYEVPAAEVVLLISPLEDLEPAINHGDGVCVDVPTDIPLPPARDYSLEELSAMAWKCRMQKSSPELVRQLLQRNPEECIMEMVEKFMARQALPQECNQQEILHPYTRLV